MSIAASPGASTNTESPSAETSAQDVLYKEAMPEFAMPLARLANAYEADPERRRDLLQDIHFELWRSFAKFDHRCSMRTWVYRVAHNVAATHVLRDRRRRAPMLVGLDEIETLDDGHDNERLADRALTLERLAALIQRLKPLDRRVIVLHLEGIEPAGIAEITGLSAGNVATKIHRIKQVLTQSFRAGTP